MAIRKQLYTWELYGDGGDGTSTTHYPSAGTENSILWGIYGNVQPAQQTGLVKENEFVVLEKVRCTPGISPYGFVISGVAPNRALVKWPPNMFVNVVIDTTNYYQDPQNIWASGISGTASPYPQAVQDEPYYELWPPVYVLPDQTVDVRYTLFNDIQQSASQGEWDIIPTSTMLCAVYVEYTLFDGTDAMMARKLMQLGIPITVSTVESYRQMLLKNKGLETDTFEHYLQIMQNERKRKKKERKLQGVATSHEYTGDE
jgi:hypothetical protein|tara:strand:+ start:1014 stop:1787 length:774 start_codon:yes stop_codon:yes gene_type:complete